MYSGGNALEFTEIKNDLKENIMEKLEFLKSLLKNALESMNVLTSLKKKKECWRQMSPCRRICNQGNLNNSDD